MMVIREAPESLRGVWDACVQQSPQGSFLQSWAWGEFQQAAGFLVTRFVLSAGEGTPLEAVCLLARRPLPLRRYFLASPWGPVLVPAVQRTLSATEILEALRTHLQGVLGDGGVFARIEPKFEASTGVRQELTAAGFLPVARSIQPRNTRVVDLTQSEDELLRNMHPKTRYNIRIARRHGVTVDAQTTPEGLRTFLRFAREVEKKGKFHYHTDHYYETMLRVLTPARSAPANISPPAALSAALRAGEVGAGAGGPAGMLEILVARHNGIPLAAHLLIRFGDTLTYAHGASSHERKHVMAPYLLQWESMLRGKAQGARWYDFFGIAPAGSSVSHPWYGTTRFKAGFGGREKQYIGAADVVADSTFYRLYEAGRGVRSLLR